MSCGCVGHENHAIALHIDGEMNICQTSPSGPLDEVRWSLLTLRGPVYLVTHQDVSDGGINKKEM